ncbi:MAG TPA: MBL fold metallo-hydrolase [Syntrophomonas sp.]|nr:MBL fold metallo-hydrolase [Syntrophomonas sp.]
MLKINKHIYVVDFKGFEYPHSNCMLVKDDVCCLLDSSPGEEDLKYLCTQPVDIILNSHGHIDHYLCNEWFPASKIYMHRADWDIAQSGDRYLDAFGFKTLTPDTLLQQNYLLWVKYRCTKIDQEISEGQTINLGATKIQVLHLPGHSPGHCGFFFPEQGFIFTADIDVSKFGPWYANMNSSIADYVRSIERVMTMKPEFIVSGHGEAIVKDNLQAELTRYRDIIYARQERIVELLYRGHDRLEDLARQCPVYIKFPRPLEVFFIYEEVMILAHLRYMEEMGQLYREGDRCYLKDGIRPAKSYPAY